VCKNVLNTFRQNHGYKEGRYNKMWAGKEDNLHLYEVYNGFAGDIDAVALYDALSTRHALVNVHSLN